PFWQMEKVYHNTCRALKIPDCMGTIYNPALFFELVKTLKAEAIVTVPQILPLLLSKKDGVPDIGKHFRLWYFIDGYLDPELATAIKEWTPEALIWQSFGPFPPVPAASQCVNLARAGRLNCFHHRPGHKVEIKNGKIAISSRENPAFPLIGYRTGVSGILKKESCPCGADKLLQIHD
ncbi:MAG: hypothetical protein HYS78_02195, partial [Parcubacteria group bacterium]|nr:hypothetical protein [Parcubacteria group bacterium]